MIVSETVLLDTLIRRLEQERQRNPGADLLAAQQICVDVVQEYADAEKVAARRAQMAITAARLLDAQGGVR